MIFQPVSAPCDLERRLFLLSCPHFYWHAADFGRQHKWKNGVNIARFLHRIAFVEHSVKNMPIL